ncbi:hypothetical protein H8A95_03225 [Bradyrhizobium sp. Pear76]|nr:hypothetical protein [Bradyrhizobium oropedii]MCC8961353.1 hypothetical protein [Bradyrhizobium oropedii]
MPEVTIREFRRAVPSDAAISARDIGQTDNRTTIRLSRAIRFSCDR